MSTTKNNPLDRNAAYLENEELLKAHNPLSDSETNSNFLTPTRFIFVIDTPELMNISYNCQTVSIPSVTAESIPAGYRQMKAFQSPSSITFAPFEARFIIDETLKNYEIVFDWMKSLALEQKRERDYKADVTLLVYNNNNKCNIRFRMVSCFPTSLTPVEFDVTKEGTEYLFADISFSIDYYSIERGKF